jgi:hypothetical protein
MNNGCIVRYKEHGSNRQWKVWDPSALKVSRMAIERFVSGVVVCNNESQRIEPQVVQRRTARPKLMSFAIVVRLI